MKLTMFDLAGFRCRQHTCKHGATGRTDCHSCNAFILILEGYGFDPEKFGMKCGLHPQQKSESCQLCATHLAMREVDIGEAITVEQAPVAPVYQKLALRMSGDIMLKEKQMKRETKIERELEHQAINELLRISDTIRNKSPSPDEACEILDYLKQRLDELNIQGETTPKENKLIIKLKCFQCRVWNQSTCSWATVSRDRYEDRNGTMYLSG